MIRKEALLATGYKAHRHHEALCDNVIYQKAIRDESGRPLYFINFLIWRFPNREAQVSTDVRLYLPEGNALVESTGFTLNLHLGDRATVTEVEEFYASAFKALDCAPDLHND